ncbi:MAG TPA: hypothetical protein VMU07_03645 [Candidatus Paceibacterota bacterium]|nr:hypothetical protein [Candidatus Paceibacterota bacterium]
MESRPVILLVDDEDAFLDIAETQLAAEQFATVRAKGAIEGFEKALEVLPNFILSDIFMPPGPNGWELALELHQNAKTKEIPFAFFTSLRDPWSEARHNHEAIRALFGRVIFFSKTDDIPTFASRVATMVKEKHSRMK